MTLFADMMTPCALMERTRTADGEGGFSTEWEQASEFPAAIYRERTLNARIAEKQGMTDVYTITVPRDVVLGFHAVVRRLSDGKTFRTTASTEDRKTPEVATFSFARVAAEEWPLDGTEAEDDA